MRLRLAVRRCWQLRARVPLLRMTMTCSQRCRRLLPSRRHLLLHPPLLRLSRRLRLWLWLHPQMLRLRPNRHALSLMRRSRLAAPRCSLPPAQTRLQMTTRPRNLLRRRLPPSPWPLCPRLSLLHPPRRLRPWLSLPLRRRTSRPRPRRPSRRALSLTRRSLRVARRCWPRLAPPATRRRRRRRLPRSPLPRRKPRHASASPPHLHLHRQLHRPLRRLLRRPYGRPLRQRRRWLLLLLFLRPRLLCQRLLQRSHPKPPHCRSQRRSLRRLCLPCRWQHSLCPRLLRHLRRLPLRRRLPSPSARRQMLRWLCLQLPPPLRRQPSRRRRRRRARRPRPLLCRPPRRSRRPLPRLRLLRRRLMISRRGALRCWLLPAQRHPPRTMMRRLLRRRHSLPQSRLRPLLLRRPRRLRLSP